MDRPLTVWGADSRQEVWPTSRGPDPRDTVFDAAKGTVTLRAAINETASFQVAIHTGLVPVKAVDLEIGRLRNERGEDLRAEVQVLRAQPVEVHAFRTWQRMYRQDDCMPRRVFDVLVPARTPGSGLPTDLGPGAMVLAWVDVHVAKGSEPGTYSGSARVTSQGQPLWTLQLTLEVEPFALPDAPALPAMARFDARALCRAHLQLAGKPYAPVRLTAENPLAKEATQLIHAAARMLNEHGVTGIPIGYEPAMHVDADGQVRIQWEDYDQLIQPLVDGSAFAERVQPTAWPLPLDADHPPLPREGSASRAMYEKMLRQYVEQAAEHFRLRRWFGPSYAEVDPRIGWPAEYAELQRLIVPTIRQAAPRTRVLLRLPGEEMSAYGWFEWPATRHATDGAAILSVPARFFLYADQKKDGGRQHWLRPDCPPFSPSLSLGVGAIDPAATAWAAWRLRADALDLPDQGDWPESSQVSIDEPGTASDGWLFYPGTAWGATEPVPSIRLKRLRGGLQECKYLYLLGQHGRTHVDQMLAESLVPLAGNLAFGRQCIEGLDGEVQLDKGLWDAGVRLMAEEVRMAFQGLGSNDFVRFSNRVAWQAFLGRTRQVKAWAEPVRLAATKDGRVRAQVPVNILNLRAEPVAGTLHWGQLPAYWKSAGQATFGPIPPFQRTRIMLTCEGPGLGTDAAGHAVWTIQLEPQDSEAIEIPATLSAAAPMQLQKPVKVDGNLSDWKPGRFNMLSGFQSFGAGRGARGEGRGAEADARRTDAFVATDGKYLYIAMRMQDQAGEMRVNQKNTVEYDGSIPAGEDLVEILLDPDNGASGGPERLIHIIVKANGAALASLGVDMQPPVCRPRPLGTQVVAATKIYRDAWTAEVAIPLDVVKTIRPEAAYWGLNVCRLRANNIEYSSWSGARISSYHPDSLGNLLVPVR
jgi:hypothetical protein